jgi:hypothetical protein
VNATVAERGGRARAIRNHAQRDVRHARRQANPRAQANRRTQANLPTQANLRTPSPAPRAAAPGGRRPNHLRLVADHGRVIDPVFIRREAARPAGSVPNREAGDAPWRPGTVPRREARTAVQAQVRASRERGGRAAGQGRIPEQPGRAAGQGRIPEQPGRAAGQGRIPEQPGRGADRERVSRERAGRQRARERREVAGRRPVRLTRRGRLVVTSTVVLLIAIASMVLASAAQAAGHP